MRLDLDLRPESYAVVRLDPDADVPAWGLPSGFHSVTRTPDELSIVCTESAVPAAIHAHRGLRCLAVRGPLDLSEVGVLEALARPLAAAGISVFVISTHNTDYLFLPDGPVARAIDALEVEGHAVHRGLSDGSS